MEDQEIQVDKAVTDAITADVEKSFDAKFEAKAAELEKKFDDAKTAAEAEVNKIAGAAKKADAEKTKFDGMSKEQFLVAQINAVVNKNGAELQELNKHALKTQFDANMIEKATYQNAGTGADGGHLVPNAELLKDVFTLLGDYSTVAGDLRTITLTDGTSLDVATLVQDVVITEVGAEGGSKPTTKVTFGDGNVEVREFAGIAILTKKLLRQAAIEVYRIVQESFARAIAKKREQLALTDATSGIVVKDGTIVTTLGAGLTDVADVTWKHIKAVPFSVPVEAAKGAKYYVSRELLAHIDSMQDSTNRDLDIVKSDGSTTQGTFKNGYAYAVSEELGGANPHLVFGNMTRFGILLRQGAVESDAFDTGTVVDGSAVSHNLLQENKVAQRVAFYENVGFPLPGAFAILKLAAV